MLGTKKALKDDPLKVEVLKEDTPTDRCLDVMLMDGPSNSSFWTSSSTVFRALRVTGATHEQHQQPRTSNRTGTKQRGTYVSEVGASAVSELLSTLEMMVTTVEANELLMLATFTSCFTFSTTFETCEGGRRGRGVTFIITDEQAHVLVSKPPHWSAHYW